MRREEVREKDGVGGGRGEPRLPRNAAAEAQRGGRAHLRAKRQRDYIIKQPPSPGSKLTVPARREAEGVGVVGHGLEVREAVVVDHREPIGVVVGVFVWAVRRASLPVVVYPTIYISEISEGSGHAIHCAVAGDKPIHLGLDQGLVHVAAVEVPAAMQG